MSGEMVPRNPIFRRLIPTTRVVEHDFEASAQHWVVNKLAAEKHPCCCGIYCILSTRAWVKPQPHQMTKSTG